MPFLGDFYKFANDRGIIQSERDYYDEAALPIASALNMENGGAVDYTHKDLTIVHDAVLPVDFAEEFIYNRIWITEEIDFEFIVEIETDYIGIWNAYLGQSATITAFDDPGHSGISIETVTTPLVLDPNEEKTYLVTVTPAGPAEQDTTYTWTINGEDFEAVVLGKRVLPFPFPANWMGGTSIEYAYDTIMYSAPTTHEQRRSSVDQVRRTSSFNCLLTNVQAQKFDNLYRKGAYRYFGVPVYSEIFTTDSTITGQTTIIANEDLTYFFNLQNYCTQVVIVDHNTSLAEIKLLSSIVGQTLTFDVEVDNTFTPSSTVIYPIYIGMLETYSYKSVTDAVVEVGVSFKEVFVG